MNLERVAAVVSKEWREILRDRLFFVLAFVQPTFVMLLLCYGLSFDVENLPLAVVDHDGTRTSRDYASRFVDSRYFDFKGYAPGERVLDHLLIDNEIRVAIIVPERFEAELVAGRPASVQTLIDGTFPYRAQAIKQYVIAINEAFSTELLIDHLARTRGLTREEARQLVEPVALEVRYLYNQSMKSIWSIAPKVMMVVLLVYPAFLTALGIVREKESGAIYNIYASSVTRAEFLVGKLLPYAAIAAVNAAILWLLAVLFFGAPFKGDPVFFAAASILYVTCSTGIGLLVSLVVRTQAAAMTVTNVGTMIAATLYSGLIVPVESLSESAKVVAHLLPSVYYADIVTGAFLKGMGAAALWLDALALVVYATILRVVGYALFTKRPRS